MPPGLFHRNGRYSLRSRVPKALVDHYGKAEIVRALGTGDPKDARLRHPKATVALNEEFEAAKRLLSGAKIDATSVMPPSEVEETNAFDPAAFPGRALAIVHP